MVSSFIDGDRFEPVFRPAIEAVLAVADTDDDGALGRDELLHAVRDYYISADPNAIGNLFFGRLAVS